MCSDVDIIAAATLQLHLYPERAKTHTVMLHCRMESGETGALKDLLHAKLNKWPSRTRNKIPTTFQLTRAAVRLTTELHPTIREPVEKIFEIFVQNCVKQGVLPNDNILPFRVIWTKDSPEGELNLGYVVGCGIFLPQHVEFLKHCFVEYGAEACAYTMIRNFNINTITDPERMKKMTMLLRKDLT
ncbi:hypothetical protein BD410DRAFT_791511, partial [Rickenella mellea]